MERLTFKLPVFEGPMDALLYLITKNKLSIIDIPIAELLDQYMEYLSTLSEMDMEVTSEFLDMASRLVQIKTAMLLPKPPEEDPRDELVQNLMEYKTCKEMAQALRERGTGFDCFVRAPAPIEHDNTYRQHHEVSELTDAYRMLRGKMKRRLPPPASEFRQIVGTRIVSVTSRIIHVLKRLVREGGRPFRSLFEDAGDRSEAVATFLAVLELVKSRKIVVEETAAGELVKMAKR